MQGISMVAALMLLWSSAFGFGGSDERFIKKYAMMKIYESCFGPEVAKQIRKEMKAACAKCVAMEAPAPTPQPPQRPLSPPIPGIPSDHKMDGITEPENTIYANQQTFNPDKLHHAILAFRPNQVPSPAFRPYNPPNPGYYPGYPAPAYPNPMFFSGYQQQPFGASPYGMPMISPYLGSQRTARDMDIRGQLEALTSKMSGRVRNVTCVMQELGYLDENLEPNFAKISEKISNLPVSEELRRDLQDSVTFCQQFSQCVPDVKKDKFPLSLELIRPIHFFKCYKHKKLEACIMKDMREKYPEVGDEDFDSDMEIRRQGKSAKLPEDDSQIDELADSVYEFLYASDSSMNIDAML